MAQTAVATAGAVQTPSEQRKPEAQDFHGNPDVDTVAREAWYAENSREEPVGPPDRAKRALQARFAATKLATGGAPKQLRSSSRKGVPVSSRNRPPLPVRGMTEAREAQKKRQRAQPSPLVRSSHLSPGMTGGNRRVERDTPDLRRPASRRSR